MTDPPLERCSICRVMRGFALGGAGAILATSIAFVLGEEPKEIAPWAIVGALLMWAVFPKPSKKP